MTSSRRGGTDVVVKLRLAEPKDAQSIARVQDASWRVAYRGIMSDDGLDRLDVAAREQLWREVLSQREWPVFVAEDGGGVAGFCHICAARDDDLQPHTIAEITAIYVDPAAWRRGYGRTLCEAATAEVRRRGFATVVLWVLERNAEARKFYHALGFIADGHAKDDEEGVREVRYRKQLGKG